ncbi:MAG: hypothetical protein AAF362_11945 [Pseudomonadota bacterium]
MPEPYDILLPAALIAYLAGQGAAFYFMTGRWRIAASIPFVIFLLALGLLIIGIFMGANLAGVYLVLAIPLCLLYIVLLWIAFTVFFVLRQ